MPDTTLIVRPNQTNLTVDNSQAILLDTQSNNSGLSINFSPIRLVIDTDNALSISNVGARGEQGVSYQEQFETVSKNLNSWDAVFNYTAGDLTSIVYTSGASSITKTFNYTAGDLTSIVLSGSTPSGISLTKTLSYTAGDLTGVTYS